MWLLAFFILLLSQSLSLRTLSPTRQRLTKSNSISHVHTYRQSSSHNVLYSSSRCEKYSEFLNRGKRWGGPIFGSIIRQINTIVVGLLFGFILRIRNTFRSIRANILFDRIWNRPAEQGLVTVSNHKSFYDDPGLWAALLPWWRITNHRLRWSLCTEDVFFAHPVITSILGAGNVIPLDRSGAIDQPLLQAFFRLLDRGQWCHIFAEGKVRQNWRFEANEPRLGEFKLGVGKLIAHCKVCPIVIPIYHTGMDDVLPEVVLEDRKSKKASKPISFIPRKGLTIEMYFGEPIDFSDTVSRFKQQFPDMLNHWRTTTETLQLYGEITDVIRQKVLLLEAEANKRQVQVESESVDPSPVISEPSDTRRNGPIIA